MRRSSKSGYSGKRKLESHDPLQLCLISYCLLEIPTQDEVIVVTEHQCELHVGHAIAWAVSRWLATEAARVRARVRTCETCGGQSGTGAGFLPARRFPPPIILSTAP
jgi:hypothetical protein